MINQSKSSRVSLDALKGRQSVRATFTLPKQSIDLLSAVASQLGVKQKSIFDHLVEDDAQLGQVVDQARNYRPGEKKRKQKTFVLSRQSLSTLDAVAKTHKLPRDVLVEYSIRQLRPVIDAEKEKHENRKSLLKEMRSFLGQGMELAETARRLVGEDDPISEKIISLVTLHGKHVQELESMIQKGRCMEKIA